jgi:metal transporter CNNM
MLQSDMPLGYDAMRAIFESGFTRIPVYGNDRHDFRGMLNTKDLMLADPEDEMKLGDFIGIFDRKVENFTLDTSLTEALETFKKGKTHLALVRHLNLEDGSRPRIEVRGLITLEDVIEEILQEEIVDEHDVYVDVDKQIRVHDGRERRVLNLGVFNPVWRTRDEQLTREEVSAIASHLHRSVFHQTSGMSLGIRAIEWLVGVSSVENREKKTAAGCSVPDPDDLLYKAGWPTDHCLLVLQGRSSLLFGRDELRADAGSFSILARHALVKDRFCPDFTAFVATDKARFLSISRANFETALKLNTDEPALSSAFEKKPLHTESDRTSLLHGAIEPTAKQTGGQQGGAFHVIDSQV